MNFRNFKNFQTVVIALLIWFPAFAGMTTRAQTIGTLPELVNPSVNDIFWIQTASTDYKITLQNIYNKLLGRNNEWNGTNTFNGLTNFDSSVVMRGSQSYYSNNYTPGWLGSGFNLDYGQTYANESNLVLDNMTIRGTLSVYELLLRRINATNGNFVIAAAAKINAIGVAPDSTLLFVEDPTGNGLAPFAKDDLVTVRVYAPGSSSITRETKATVDTVYTYTQPLTFLKFAAVGITYDEGTKPKGGDVLVRMGNRTDSTRMNLIYMSSEDDGAPFIQFKRGIDDWAKVNDESTTILYMGKLDGYTDPDFGALAGDGIVLKNLYAKGAFEITGGSAREQIDSLVAANLLLGDMAYEDIVELAKLGSTIIQGGYIKTTLLDVVYIFAQAANITNTLTMGSASTSGIIQSYGWNGTAPGFRLVGGSSPSFDLIGGNISGGTISGAEGIATSITGAMYAYGSFQAGNTTPTMISNAGITNVKGVAAAGNEGTVLRSDGLSFVPATLGFGDLSGTSSVVQTSGSYSNPSWITSLAASKISGVVSNADQANYASSVAWSSITGKPSTFTPSAHTHALTDITGLVSTINTMQLQISDLNDRVTVLEGYH